MRGFFYKTEHIYIKAQCIRSIEYKGHQKIEEDVSNDFVGIVNYAVIGSFLTVRINDNFVNCEQVTLPFYDPKKKLAKQ